MSESFSRRALSAAFVALSFMLTWFLWNKGQQLALSLSLIFVAVLAVAALHAGKVQAVLRPLTEVDAAHGGAGAALATLAALGCAWWADRALMDQRWWTLIVALLLGSAFWRLCLPLQPPKMGQRLAVLAGALVLVLAALFRLYKAGAIPEGFAGVDEPSIWARAYSYLNGLRETYAIWGVGGDGTIPFYLEALGLKLFGGGFTGWRMEGILMGVAVTPLIYLVGREVQGRWTGFCAAMLWAVGVWPVTISRAQYFVVESLGLVLLFMAAFFLALRRRSAVLYALAGLFWAFTFNAYPGVRVLLILVPWIFVLLAFRGGERRAALRTMAIPFGAAFLVGLAPLLLWFLQQPWNFKGYAAAFHTGNQISVQTTGVLAGLNELVERSLRMFSVNVKLYTQSGPVSPFYFPMAYPVLHPTFLFFFVAGFSACLAQFRRPLHAALVYWWFAGILPALVSVAGSVPNDRRAMMTLPPTLLIAGVGLSTSLDGLTRAFTGGARVRNGVILAAFVGLAAWLGSASWHDYFERNQKSYDLMAWNRVNGARVIRAIWAENEKGPVAVVMTRHRINDNFYQPSYDPYRGDELPAVCWRVPVTWVQEESAYYATGGFFSALKWAAEQRQLDADGKPGKPYDVVVALEPFYFYLQPLLEKLGGKVVAEVPIAEAAEGKLRGDVSLAYSKDLSARLMRLQGLTPAAVDALGAGSLFEFQVDELAPPGVTDRTAFRQTLQGTPEYQKWVDRYLRSASDWKVLHTYKFAIPDPWFWQLHGNLPGMATAPYRVRSRYVLHVPEDGDYALGASASLLTTLRLNGRVVFQRDPLDPRQRVASPPALFLHDPDVLDVEPDRRGFVGAPISLKKGTYQLDSEQVFFTSNPAFSQVHRLVWQRAGGEIETLPLEVLSPR